MNGAQAISYCVIFFIFAGIPQLCTINHALQCACLFRLSIFHTASLHIQERIDRSIKIFYMAKLKEMEK